MAFGRTRNGEPTEMAAAPAPRPPADEGNLTAFIDQGSSFEGKLSFNDTVRIDGQFTGEITSENTLIVGESGEIQAAIKSQTVIVSGNVHGDVVATRKLVLHKTARLEGNVETPTVVMEEGAVLNGMLTMASADKAPKATLPPKPSEGGLAGGLDTPKP